MFSLLMISELEIHSVCMELWRWRICHPLLIRCLNKCLGQRFFSKYCIHLLKKPVRTDLLLSDRWQTSVQACMHLLLNHVRLYSNVL